MTGNQHEQRDTSGVSGALTRYLTTFQALAVAVVGALLYGHTLHAPWYMDDITFILTPSGGHGLGNALAALFGQRGFARLTFALNFQFGGLDPVGYHLVNIAIHLAAACLVLLLLRRVFPEAHWLPLCGALIFVAHPLQTQAVTYVVQRMASLSALCFLLSLYLFVRGRELLAAGCSWRHPRHLALYVASLLAGLLAILAKENAIVLPLALLLFARCFSAGTQLRWRPLLLYIAPFCLAPLVITILLFFSPLLSGEAALDRLGHAGKLVSLAGNSPLHYLFTEFSVLWIYIRLLFLPFGQAFDHGYPVVRELLTVKNIVGLSGLLALGGLAVRLRHRQPAIAAGILWFFLTLLVESSIIPLDPLLEHRLYLPMFGFAMVLPALISFLPRPALRNGAMIGVVLVMAILAWQRNALWNDRIAFCEDNLRRAPHNERVCKDLAFAYLTADRTEEAIPLLERTLQINPRFIKGPYVSLADIYFSKGREADARKILEEGIRNFPDDASLYNNLAVIYARAGEEQRASDLLRQGLKIKPVDGKLYVTLGKLLLNRGALVEAEEALRQGIARGAAGVETYHALAQALQRQGRSSEAAQQLDIARSLEGKENRQGGSKAPH